MKEQLLARLMALSQRFKVTTDFEIGISWRVGDIHISFGTSDVTFSMYTGNDHLCVTVPEENLLLDFVGDGNPNVFQIRSLDKSFYVNAQLERLTYVDTQSDDFKSIDDIIDRFSSGAVYDELMADDCFDFNALKVLANMDLKSIDKYLAQG